MTCRSELVSNLLIDSRVCEKMYARFSQVHCRVSLFSIFILKERSNFLGTVLSVDALKEGSMNCCKNKRFFGRFCLKVFLYLVSLCQALRGVFQYVDLWYSS